VLDNLILYLVFGGFALGVGAWAGWTLGARRARRPRSLVPDRLWLCDACHSFNEPEREACYGCRRSRPADARSVVPDAEFHIDQRFGRVTDLRDRWLDTRPSAEPVVPPADDASPPTP
jgi:hypothetical protein